MYEIRLLMQLLKQCNFSISHILRESNMAVDFLSNVGCKEGRKSAFDHCNIPHKLRGILRVDRSGLANVRRVKGG